MTPRRAPELMCLNGHRCSLQTIRYNDSIKMLQMAQLLVRDIEGDVKERLQRGQRSMATVWRPKSATSFETLSAGGLGTAMARGGAAAAGQNDLPHPVRAADPLQRHICARSPMHTVMPVL